MGAEWNTLEAQKFMLLSRALAPNTVTTYRTGINHYLKFCSQVLVSPLPLTENIIENFCASLYSRVSYKAIKVYLCGVQFWSKLHGCPVLIKNMPRLEYVTKAIRRAQGGRFSRPLRPPITWRMLRRICAFVAQSELPFDSDMLTAAVLLAYFGLLRVSEYTSPSSTSFDGSAHLGVSDVDIQWERRVALVTIKMSKTDPFRAGVTVRVGVLSHYLCPVHALVRYLIRRGSSPGPLFLFRNGAYLTRAHVLDVLVRSLPDIPNVNTHSFRRGGASALAAANTPSHVIQVLGRWRSNAYAQYIQLDDDFLVQANKNMARGRQSGPSSSG